MVAITLSMTGFNAFALSGRDCSYMGRPRVSLRFALGYVLHWAFSPSLLNP